MQNENDNALYCGGFGVQHQQNGGRCGICGDPWDAWPRQNEAPHGIYATGIIGKTYRQVGMSLQQNTPCYLNVLSALLYNNGWFGARHYIKWL